MKDRHTGQPRGFGFITYADPSVVDQVIMENHVINDKQVNPNCYGFTLCL
jgi:heterogeneous nuclear ribonucleoprotein A1/A3